MRINWSAYSGNQITSVQRSFSSTGIAGVSDGNKVEVGVKVEVGEIVAVKDGSGVKVGLIVNVSVAVEVSVEEGGEVPRIAWSSVGVAGAEGWELNNTKRASARIKTRTIRTPRKAKNNDF
jgi:hypothetical protein